MSRYLSVEWPTDGRCLVCHAMEVVPGAVMLDGAVNETAWVHRCGGDVVVSWADIGSIAQPPLLRVTRCRRCGIETVLLPAKHYCTNP